MRSALAIALVLPLCVGAAPPDAVAPIAIGFEAAHDEPKDDVTPAQRSEIWRAIDANLKLLAVAKAGERPSFTWPIRAARGNWQTGVDTLSNYFDHDSGYPNRLRDFNCGTRTYDTEAGYNHQGIDISFWPDSWGLMQKGQLEIVAAAPGTIVAKHDGNFDQNCQLASGLMWNAVYVQHDDGSIAWYGHMKNGSLTAKPVGARVVAGEFLGTVGSSGNSSGPHLHFEVYDANRRLVDPFSGSCNTRNAESWWAEQPAYRIPRVNRVITSSALQRTRTCAEGRMQDPGSLNLKTDFAPGDLAYFVAYLRDAPMGETVTFAIRRPDGSVWRTLTTDALPQDFSSAYYYVSYVLPAGEPPGTWSVEARMLGSQSAASFTVTPGAAGVRNYTDLWWNPAEAGWGVNLNHQGETLFATWFTYDSDGSPMWLVMPDARGTASRMAGTIHRTTGVPFDLIAGSGATTSVPAVGTGTFEFVDRDRATFSYTLNGISQAKSLQRQVFATPARCVAARFPRNSATNYQDLWWNPAEPGWGVNLTHQGEIIFATWFTYGADGRGQWLVGSEVRRQPTGEFRGRLYRTNGRAFNAIAGSPATAGVTDVGEIVLSFTDGVNGRMTYTVNGLTQSKAITRQVFGDSSPLCE